MPYFSFSLKEDIKKDIKDELKIYLSKLKPNKKYYSKNTVLWKTLNNKKLKEKINFVQYEKRNKLKIIGTKLLICLPPSIGLGYSIEYALSIKALIDSGKFKCLGVAFVGKYKKIFRNYFNIKNIFEETISEKDIKKYSSIFHVTLEIKELFYQKYERKDIETLLTSFFNVKKYRKNFKRTFSNHKKKISIFPISQSPLRTMTIDLINDIIKYFNEKYAIDIVLDKKSTISNFIESKITKKSIKILHPKDLSQLLKKIEKINFGIFVDSGPLHVAKVLYKEGIIITSTVSGKILVNDYRNIKIISNNYNSKYCKAPCGLVNVFNFNNNVGCYDSLKVNKKKILQLNNLNKLQRGNLKESYVKLVSNPVNCLKKINNLEVIKKVEKYLNYEG